LLQVQAHRQTPRPPRAHPRSMLVAQRLQRLSSAIVAASRSRCPFSVEKQVRKVSSGSAAVATRVIAEAARMRVVDFRMPSGGRSMVHHEVPTLRWEVASDPTLPTPAPTFFDAGSAHEVVNSSSNERREICFELLGGRPSFDMAAVQAREAAAQFDTLIGTGVNFENELCRAVEIRTPPGRGEPVIIHQHVMDYALVFVGGTKVRFWQPGPDGRPAHTHDATLEDGHGMFKEGIAERGGFDADGRPDHGWAVHGLTNNSETDWLRCLQVELK